VQSVAVAGAVPQPVTQSPLPMPAPPQVVYNERAEREARAQRAAEAWLVAQGILNDPYATKAKRSLYGALCNAGDRSACFMADAL
jgi:hypothetical protein